MKLEAERVESTEDGGIRATGSPRIDFGAGVLSADEIRVTGERRIKASGDVLFEDSKGNSIRGESLEIDARDGSGEMTPVDIVAEGEQPARLGGTSLKAAGDVYKVNEAYYTTCPADMEVWRIVADHFEFDADERVARAESAKLMLGDVPVFYLPWVSFSTDRKTRKSGFLTPNLRQRRGDTSIRTPYYFNLAPNYDATIEPTTILERGVLFNGEFRYLQKDYEGAVSAGFIGDDKIYKENGRSRFMVRHRGSLSEWTRWGINAERVSDDEYLRDFTYDTEELARRNLPFRAFISNERDGLGLHAEIERFQHIRSDTERPHDALPRVSVNYGGEISGFHVDLETEVVNFKARDTDMVEGVRVRETFSVSRGSLVRGIYLEPVVGMNLARYALSDSAGSSSPGYAVPFFTVDASVPFRRTGAFFNWDVEQTLEPRVFYSYAPARSFSGHPNFDTAVAEVNYTSLFSRRRFVGGDRISDSNFVSYGMTSRMWDLADGRELMQFSLAQRIYLDQPEVLLPSESRQRGDYSDLYLSADFHPVEAVRTAARLKWNPERSEIDRAEVEGQVRFDSDVVLNAAFFDIREENGETDSDILLEALFPAGRRVEAVVSANYSLEEHHMSDGTFGLRYRGECGCWQISTVMERYVESESNSDNNISFWFELIGLGGVGDSQFEDARRDVADFW